MENPIRRSAAPLADTDLAAFEERLGFALPAPYRAFLLAHNGGVPRRNTFAYVNKQGQRRDAWLRRFYSLGRAGLIEPDASDLEMAYQERARGLPAGMLPIGAAYFIGNEGEVCIACTGPDTGKVFFRPRVEADKTTLYAIADGWDEFLSTLRYEEGKPVPWKIALEEGDLPALRKWLEAHPKRWREDRAYSLDIERTALEENRWPALVVLMEFGFEPTSLFEEALKYNRYDLARQLLQTGKVGKRMIRECLTVGTAFLWYLPGFLEELVAAGADVNHETDYGSTPLHHAVEARSDEGVRFLVRHGADPTVRNDDKHTPLTLAQRLEEPKLIPILREAEEAWKQRPVETGPELVELDLHGVELTPIGPPVTLEDIRTYEEMIGLSLPPEYRALLLKANGATLRPNQLVIERAEEEEDGDEDEYEEDDDSGRVPQVEFLPLFKGQGRQRTFDYGPQNLSMEWHTVDSAREYYHDGSEIPRGKVTIGWLEGYGYDMGGFLLLGCKGRDRGKLFAFEHGPAPLHLTLPELFAALAAGANRPPSPADRLADAIAGRDLAGVRAALADGAGPLKPSSDGRYPLHLACESGFEDAIVAMVEAGMDFDELFANAAPFVTPGLMCRLLAHGKGPSKKALAAALTCIPALYGDVALLREFVARGVDLGKVLRRQPHALAAAASVGSVDGLRFVLEHGGDIQQRDEQGATLLHHAAAAQSGDGAAVLRHLLSLGVPINQPTAQGHTALHWAVMAGNLEAAKALLDAGEDLHARHKQHIPGMRPEDMARYMEGMQGMLDGNLVGMMEGMTMADEDGPPPPDTSTPLGEKLAELHSLLQQKKQEISAKLTERMAGNFGAGPSAAEVAAQTPQGQAILSALQAYAARR